MRSLKYIKHIETMYLIKNKTLHYRREIITILDF